MSRAPTIPEGSQSRGTPRVALTISGVVSPADQVCVVDAFEQLCTDPGHRVLCGRFRVDTTLDLGHVAIADGIIVLKDGRVLCAWSADRTVQGAARDLGRRLRKRTFVQQVLLDRTA